MQLGAKIRARFIAHTLLSEDGAQRSLRQTLYQILPYKGPREGSKGPPRKRASGDTYGTQPAGERQGSRDSGFT